MPTDASLHFYKCTACHAMLRPKPGDCCVFCSYGGEMPAALIETDRVGVFRRKGVS